MLGDALIHEATHTSMDAAHINSGGWLAAMESDGVAISRYAADFPKGSKNTKNHKYLTIMKIQVETSYKVAICCKGCL